VGVPDGLEVALDEATVVGLRAEPDGAVALLLHVLALPEEGPPHTDTRRALVLSGVSRLRVLLRRDEPAEVDYGPALPLPDLTAVEDFFASLTRSGDLYGGEYLDAPDQRADWPPEVSLDMRQDPPARETHTLYWFNECAAGDETFCIEGEAEFTALTVRHADGTPLPTEQFIAEAQRWWHAFHTGDPRVSAAAQQTLRPSPRWR
jgi:hypothetical protein